MRGHILAGVLPSFSRGLRHVENVVDDLESEAERLAEIGQALQAASSFAFALMAPRRMLAVSSAAVLQR